MHSLQVTKRHMANAKRAVRFVFLAIPWILVMSFSVCSGQSYGRTETPLEKENRERKEKLAERFGKSVKNPSANKTLNSDEEYYRLAPYLSMDFDVTPAAVSRRVGGVERALQSDKQAFQQALDLHRVAELLSDASPKKLTGSPLSPHQKMAVQLIFDEDTVRELNEDEDWHEYIKGMSELAQDIVKWNVNEDLKSGLEAGNALIDASLEQMDREDAAETLFLKSRELEIAAWKSIEKYIPSSDKSLNLSSSIAMEIRVDTTTRHSGRLVLRNTSGGDLHRVTMNMKTRASRMLKGHLMEFYLYLPIWKKDANVSLDKTLISALLHGEIKPPVSKAIQLSMWSDQGDDLEKNYDLPKSKPVKINSHELSYPLKIGK